jgi:hypothetical protein
MIPAPAAIKLFATSAGRRERVGERELKRGLKRELKRVKKRSNHCVSVSISLHTW